MFNLIRKDIMLQKTTLMTMLPLLILLLTLERSFIYIGLLFSMAIIMNAFASDEKSSINTLLNSLPYTRKEIVSSKYIGALFFVLTIVLTIFTGNLIINREITMWKELGLIICLVMIFISFMFPFSYKFKSQYLLTAVIVSFVIYLLIVNLFINNLNDKIRELVGILLTLQSSQLYLLIAFSVIALYVCSWLLSIRIYSKKVF
ncbi:ABC-2 transporter permease [Solibacillus sp. CAU 1738]|uniref:ABC-2 transporter permease n=1 Tax=Solibacillus sp. CAU 1738 TaxID=3140363 RepID=UPI003261785B